ncbi:hypothetical protein E5D57_005174 [Metarhizium anisopliae]|nr:hypothetical protein E5D57_005174 [Metarhizium anisopliae]
MTGLMEGKLRAFFPHADCTTHDDVQQQHVDDDKARDVIAWIDECGKFSGREAACFFVEE